MSWDQEYHVPSVSDLFEQLTGKTAWQLLQEELERQGSFVKNYQDIILDDGMYQTIRGTKVTLTDGRVFVPKLVERFSENGNHGIDVYQYFLENETPNISYTGTDHAEVVDPPMTENNLPNYDEEVDEDPFHMGEHQGEWS